VRTWRAVALQVADVARVVPVPAAVPARAQPSALAPVRRPTSCCACARPRAERASLLRQGAVARRCARRCSRQARARAQHALASTACAGHPRKRARASGRLPRARCRPLPLRRTRLRPGPRLGGHKAARADLPVTASQGACLLQCAATRRRARLDSAACAGLQPRAASQPLKPSRAGIFFMFLAGGRSGCIQVVFKRNRIPHRRPGSALSARAAGLPLGIALVGERNKKNSRSGAGRMYVRLHDRLHTRR
jgi:hypothetical protein